MQGRKLTAALGAALAAMLATAAAASAAPTLTVAPALGLKDGQTIDVSGTGHTTVPPAIYVGQVAVVDGTVQAGASRWVHRTPTSPTQVQMDADGGFATTLVVDDTVGTADCRIVQCEIAAWPAHTNPTVATLIARQPLSFGPSIRVQPSTDLDPAGATVTVDGAGFDPADNTTGDGLYVAQSATVNGTRLYRAATWVRTTGGAPALNADGTFTTTIDVVGTGDFSDGGPGAPTTRVDCTDPATPCSIVTRSAHDGAVAAWSTAVALTFDDGSSNPGPGPGTGGGPALVVSPTTGLSPDGPTTISVTGSGYDATAQSHGHLRGVYLVYGPKNGDFFTNANAFGAAAWLQPGNGMSLTGSFATTITVKPTYVDGAGNTVNCTVTQCYVATFAAHGSADRSQDVFVPVTFAGTAAAAPAASPQLVPDAAPAPPPAVATTTASGTKQATARPKVSRVKVGRTGRVTLRVTEPARITFTVKRKAGKRWVKVKTVKVTARKAGTVRANLRLARTGRYRVSVKAVGRTSGKAAKTVVASVRVVKR